MKRLLFAVVIAALAGGLMDAAYSPLFATFWSRHEFVRMVISYSAYPTVLGVQLLLSAFGVDATLSVSPLIAGAVIQWFLAAYLILGTVFREDTQSASPGGLRG